MAEMNRTLCATLVLMSALLLSARSSRADITPHAESLAEAVRQSDGIASRVVDDVWKKTDYYWHRGDYNRIIALDRICVSADPSFTEAYSVGAWLMWSMGDTAAADRFLADGVANSPQGPAFQFEFGWHLYNTKRFADALPHLKAAVEGGDPDRTAYTLLAHCYRMLHRYDDSIAVWKTVILKFPTFAAAQPNLERVEALKRGASAPPAATPTPPKQGE
jgi:tetratricopeptide (TPR) repeat protein